MQADNDGDEVTDTDASVDTQEVEENFMTVKEAFMASWKAKQKTNKMRKARGFSGAKG